MHKRSIGDDAAKACLVGSDRQGVGPDARHADIGGHAPQVIAVRAAAHSMVVGKVAIAGVDDYRPGQRVT